MNCIDFRIATIAAALGLAAPHAAWSQAYPTKPIRIVVPFAPGVSLDLLARRMGQKISEAFGQPVVVDNAGGVAIIGTAQVARAAPDGHTIALITVGEVIGAVYLRRDRSLLA